MIKKFSKIFLILLILTTLLSGCKVQTVEEHDSSVAAEEESLSAALNDTDSSTEESDETTVASDNTADSESSSDTGTTSDSDSTSDSGTTSGSEITSDSGSSSSSDSTATSTSTSDSGSSSDSGNTTTETTTSSTIIVYLTVQCSNVYGLPTVMRNDDIDFSNISDDGYWLVNENIVVDEGDTVYDVLCNARTLGYLTFEETSSHYIESIYGLEEGLVSSESGWKYAVNGTIPGTGCSNTTVEAGDTVTWFYVTSSTQTLN